MIAQVAFDFLWRKLADMRFGLFLFSCICLGTGVAGAMDYNAVVLDQIRRMPAAGGYSTAQPAHDALRAAIQPGSMFLQVHSRAVRPSYCSGATYLVFLESLNRLAAARKLYLSEEVQQALILQYPHPDGLGVWGRWNANGPGTARLFYETGMGENFVDPERARPGDFLKIFWTDAVGRDERGHLVVFMGFGERAGKPTVRYWSSNKPDGFSMKETDLDQCANMIFSRLTRPERISAVVRLPEKDAYLASLLKEPSSFREACLKSGIPLP